jgi:stearoyl-CoA desaturase (delta-9 desaturase)
MMCVILLRHRFYLPSVLLLCFVIPTVVPVYFWSESAVTAYFICAVLRYVLMLNVTWMVNSVAHLWGNRPYDRRINSVENIFVAATAIGEGFHNYHHVFPSDYQTSEHGWRVNPTTFLIDFMAFIGLVTERKKMSPEAVQRRRERTGDGTTGFGYF